MRSRRQRTMVAGVTAVIAAVTVSVTDGATMARAESFSRAGQAPGNESAYDVAGTLTYSGHGKNQLDAGTTVPPTSPDGGCDEATSYLKISDSYSFSGHYSGALGNLSAPTPKLSGQLLGLKGTGGCSGANGMNIVPTSYACTASPLAYSSVTGGLSGKRWELTVYTVVHSGIERPSQHEACIDGGASVQDLPNGDYLEDGGTIAFSLPKLEKFRSLSFTLDSHADRNCASDPGDPEDFTLPAEATSCVDPTNAKNGLCPAVFPVPGGGSSGCDETNDWVERFTFRLSQVCSTSTADIRSREPLGNPCD